MVRVIVLGLALVNLLFFGWAEWIDVPAPPQPSATAGLPRLTLVKDLPPAKRAALARKMVLQSAPPQCVSVGPFDDPAIVLQAVTLLRAKSFAPQQRAVPSAAIRRFWVHLDGFSTDAAVTRVLHRLEHGGIDDAEAMPAEAGGRKISLGLFSDRQHADQRAKAVRALGLKPHVDVRMVPGMVYWLDLTLPNSSASVPLKDVSSLQPGSETSPISVQPCPAGSAPPAPAGSASPPASAPQSSAAASAQPPTLGLPQCRPDGGGPVPCVAAKSRDVAHPSVF